MRSLKTLLLENFESYYINVDDQIKPLDYLPYVNKINIFIGTNNSGKSKFMRKLMSLTELITLHENFFEPFNQSLTSDPNRRIPKLERGFSIIEKIRTLIDRGQLTNTQIERYRTLVTSTKSPKFYYIPTLRTAHTLYQEISKDVSPFRDGSTSEYKKIEEDILLHTLRKNYSLDEKIEVFTGIHLYKDILNTRNSKRETRKKFESFEVFISQSFFDGKAVDIISEFDKDESQKGNNTKEIISIHIEGEKESRDLFHLGDGIQALILLMYKIFMADKNSYIFIDEPEINLHPGMQRLFLDQITNNLILLEKNLTYYLSTHSNHFLDLSLEAKNVSIYSFYSELENDGMKKLIVKNVNSGDNDVLKTIGVNNSSVFMANCSIWVEGISDRIYIRAFLKAYCKYLDVSYPKEDIDFAFFEYAGTNLSHYFFDDMDEEEQNKIVANINAMALSNRIFLLADSDNASKKSKKGKKLKKLEDAETNSFKPTIVKGYREIENFLPNEVWESLLINFFNKKINSDEKTIAINKLIETLKVVNSKNFNKKYIGEYLNEVRIKLGRIGGKFIVNESEYFKLPNNKFGTLKNKKKISEAFAKKEYDWEILKESNGVEDLTIKIYTFITQ